MPITGLDHVQIAAPARCEDAARRFYGLLLGLAEVAKPPGLRERGGVWFACGEQELHVGVAESFVPAEKAHPALCVSQDAIDPLAERLAQQGFKVDWDRAIPERR